MTWGTSSHRESLVINISGSLDGSRGYLFHLDIDSTSVSPPGGGNSTHLCHQQGGGNSTDLLYFLISRDGINDMQRSGLRRPISKIRMILLMDAKIWMISLIIIFAVHPTCVQDSIFKMSCESPGHGNTSQVTLWKEPNSHRWIHLKRTSNAEFLYSLLLA